MKEDHTNESMRSIRKAEEMSSHNHLLGKVVLLIGNDTAVLRSLVIKLAERGANVALICWQMPVETVRKLKEGVQSVGRRFLLIEQADRKMESSNQLIEAIMTEMGRLDVFIDLSAQKNRLTGNGSNKEHTLGLSKPNWLLTQAVLEELVRS